MSRKTKAVQALIGFILVGLISVIVLIVLQNRANAIPNSVQTAQEIAPAIQLPSIDGKTIDLPGTPGQVTVLYTMGYWCADCVPGAKTLARLQAEYAPRDVRFIAVDVSPKVQAADLEPFITVVGDNHLTWVLDAAGRFTYLYGIQTLDTAIILDKQGLEVYRNPLSASDTTIRAALDKLLG